MTAYRVDKRGNFYKAFSSLNALKQLPRTTPLGKKAITAAKFVIVVILFTALLLFSSRITAQNYAEFQVNESMNLSTAFIRVTVNSGGNSTTMPPIYNLTINNGTVTVYLDNLVGDVAYVDLIIDSSLFDSRRVNLIQENITTAPIENNTTNEPVNTSINPATNQANETAGQPINRDYKFKTRTKGKDISLHIKGIRSNPLVQTVEVFNVLSEENPKLNTEIIAVNESDFEQATITLPKNGPVNTILKCENWDFDSARCTGSWANSEIPFEQDDSYVWFTVNSFSGYAGGDGGFTIQTTNINACGSITASGVYNLTANILASTFDQCINITASDVIFEGQGFTIEGIETPNSYGIFVNSSGPLTNITIQNVIASKWGGGISFWHVHNSTIMKNNASNNNGLAGTYGIYLYNSSNNNITFNNASFNNGITAGTGIYLEQDSNNNTIMRNNASNNYADGVQLRISVNNTVAYNNLSANTNGNGVHLRYANNSNITNNIIKSGSFPGIKLESGNNNNTISYNYVSENGGGIYSTGSNNFNIIVGNILVSNNNDGIQISSSNNNITFNNISFNSNFGANINGNNNNISNNYIQFNTNSGLNMQASGTNTIINNTIYSNLDGIKIAQASNNNTFINNTATNSTNWDFWSVQNSRNNTVTNLNISSAMISFTSLDVAIKNTSANANDPLNYRNISRYVNATNTSANSWLFLNISYTEGTLNGVFESTLFIARNNGTWENTSAFANTFGVDTVNNYVYANISNFGSWGEPGNNNRGSIFAPLGQAGCSTCSECSTSLSTNGGFANVSADLTFNGRGFCINVGNNNTILNCNGYQIIGNNSEESIGIYLNEQHNTTIRNCNITAFHYGIYTLNNITDTTIYNNTFDNSTFGFYTLVNITSPATNQYRTVIDFNKFYNTTTAITTSQYYFYDFNITNNTFLLSANALDLSWLTRGIIRNNTINASNKIYNPTATANINITHNFILNNGTFTTIASDILCLDVGNYYMNLRAANARPKIDCGPHPAVSLIAVNETATDNATFGIRTENGNNLVYNNPVVALANANWNGSATVQFISGSRQFNLTNDAAFYVKNVENTTFDCNTAIINANSTSLLFQDTEALSIGNCTIINASKAIYFWSSVEDGSDDTDGSERNIVVNDFIANSSYGVYFQPNVNIDFNTIKDTVFDNITQSAISDVLSTYFVDYTNITNVTIRSSNTGLDFLYFRYTSVTNSTINGTANSIKIASSSSYGNVSRNNISGSLSLLSTTSDFCINGIGNYYTDLSAARTRYVYDECGPHPAVSLINVNETAANNATLDIRTENWNLLNYNHPTLAIGNANWNGSTTVRFVSGSRQFNITKQTEIYNQNVMNVTLDCNSVIINANSTSIMLQNVRNMTVANCTIINASIGLYFISNVTPSADDNKIFNNYIHNSSYGIYLEPDGSNYIYRNNIHSNLIRNATVAGIYTTSYYIYNTNITNNTIENAVRAVDIQWFEQGLINNNSFTGSTNSLKFTSVTRNNVTRNNLTGPVSAGTIGQNIFCLDVGNAYLDEAAAGTPAPNDCGPTPNIREIRVDSANSVNRFQYGSTTVAAINYSSLMVAAANAGNNTIIIVVNQTSNKFNGTVSLMYKFNVTVNCNGTTITRNGNTVDSGVDMRDTQSSSVKNCNITGFDSGTSTGILMTGNNQSLINNVSFSTPGSYGIYAASGTAFRINITNSRFRSFTAGIYAYGTSNDFWRIEGNYFANNTDGIYSSQNGYMSVINNTFYGQTGAGINVAWYQTNNSIFEFNNFTLNVNGIDLLDYDTQRNNFTNNTFYSKYGTGAAIRITGTTPTGNMFWNNTFYPGVNVTSSDTGNDNYFNDSRQGNQWMEYDTSAEGCVDANSDTFCDTNYSITGTSSESDWLPFSINPLATPNSAPTQGTPILNSSSNTNRSNENLTVYNISTADADSDAVINIINWYKNGSSIAVLNMPFDTNYSNHSVTNIIRDYSGYGSNGTAIGGITYNSTGGLGGTGTYNFGTVGQYINVTGNSLNIAGNQLTLEAWIYHTVAPDNDGIIFKGPLSNSQGVYSLIYSSSNIYFRLNGAVSEGSGQVTTTDGPYANNQWHHIVATYNGTGQTIYVDGVTKITGQYSSNINANNDSLKIGTYYSISFPFTGLIDNVKVYNKSLSAEQVQALYKNRTDLIVQQETSRGETWQACITPNDGLDDGTTSCSNNLTILNVIPTQGTPILNSSSNTNKSNENLTVYNISTADIDNDKVTNIINWYRNGSSITVLNMPFDTNYTYSNTTNIIKDYSGLGNNGTGGNGDITKTPRWNQSCGVSGGCYIFDGTDDFIESAYNSNLNVSNQITVSAWINPLYNASVLNIVFESISGHSTLNRVFLNANNVLQAQFWISNGYNDNWGGNLISLGNWSYIAYTFDGTTQSLYVNGVAAGTHSDTGILVTGTENIKIGYSETNPGSTFNGSIDEFRIYNISLTPAQIQTNYNQGLSKYNLIESSITKSNETWQACITPNDGLVDGTTSCSNNLTILGDTPTITEVNATNVTNIIINATSPAERGQNITINIIASVAEGIGSVWVRIWRGVIGISDILFEGFAQLINGIYKVNITINSSFPVGLVNYTVYVNSTLGQETNYSSNFTVLSTWAVSNCMEINLPGIYRLADSITGSSSETCFNITTSNVVFDGQGRTINGSDTALTEGIAAHNATLTNITIKNVIVTNWAIGIYFESVNKSIILDTNTSSNTNRGVELFSSTYNNITNLTAYRNSVYGLDLQQNSNSNIINYSDFSNNNAGTASGLIIEVSSNFNNVTNVTSNNNNNVGIWIYASTNNLIKGSNASYNLITGINLDTAANSNTIINNSAYGNLVWDFNSVVSSINNIVTDLDIGPVISFTGTDVGIKNATSPAADPNGFKNISKWINATNNSANGWLYLNVTYLDSDLGITDETALRIAKYRTSGWSTTASTYSSTSGVVTGSNYVFANITNFGSIFAPMANGCNSCGNCTGALTNDVILELTGNLNSNGIGHCINVQGNNTIIDCNGYSITGNNSANSVGFYINGRKNTTIRGCNITGFHYDINITGNVTDTTIFNNTFDNSTYGIFQDANGFNQYRTVVDFNKFYNTTTSAFYENTGGGAAYANNNFTNNTFLLVKNAIDGSYYRETIVRNNTINASTIVYNSGSGCCAISRGNLTHNFILNNGSLDVDPTDNYCLDVGNFYVNVRSTNSRPKEDCGPHPSVSLIITNETATNNGTFGLASGSPVVYNHPVLALGNANWNGSALVQFVSNSRQFNISKNTDEIFYSRNVANTTFDCNGVTIWANKTSLGFEDYVNTNIGNCTIKNATIGISIISRTSPGFDNNTIKDSYIYNTTYGIYLDTPGASADRNLFQTLAIINSSTTSFWAGTSSGGVTFSNITNSTIEETPIGLILNYWDTGWIQNNSIFGTTNPFRISGSIGSERNNITRNNISGGLVSADSGNRYCLDVGNAYLDEASARTPAINDCGPHPYLSEVRVDSSRETAFTWGTTDVTKVNYSSLVIATANSWNNTVIIVVNATSNNFNGSIYMQKKFNLTLDCNGTKIIRNGITTDYGIDLSNSQGHGIRNCNISGFNSGTSVGILMVTTNQTTINNVTFTTPGSYGIYASTGNVRRINITNSRFSWLSTGIYAYTGSYNNYFWLVEGNYFYNNTEGTHLADYMTVRNNTFYGTTNDAIYINGIKANESVIEFNNFTLNSYGIQFSSGVSTRNNITNNSFFKHTNYGIRFADTASTGNMIWNNSFVNTNATSLDTDNDNYFNDSRQGNHWYEYDTAAEGCANTDGNTFCDTQYNITGTSNETDWLPFSIETDTTVPSDITLNAPINGFNSSSANVLFNISATDDQDTNLTCNITFNGIVNKTLGVQSGGSNSSSVTIANIADGNYLWNATCYDNWLLSNTSVTRRLTIDTIKPAVNLSLNDTALEYAVDSILIEWNATDTNLDRYYANVSYPNGSLLSQLTNKSQQYVLGPNNLTLTGTYNITAYAADGTGNFNSTSLTFAVTDTSAPVSILISPFNNSVIASRNVSFVCNATDNSLSNVSLYTNTNGSWSVNATQVITGTNNQSNFTITGITPGTYTWNCLATDSNNNQMSNSTNYTVIMRTGCNSCSSCTTATATNGDAILLADNILSNGRGVCIGISNNNTILDCNGYSITGNNSINSIGIYINQQHNTTIQNCNITAFNYDIFQLNNVTNTKILNNTFDNSTYGTYSTINTSVHQYRFLFDGNKFYNTTYAIFTAGTSGWMYSSNVTNNTFLLVKEAFTGRYVQESIVRNNTINASIQALGHSSGYSGVFLRTNSTHNFILNNGTFQTFAKDNYCLDVGNYYVNVRSTNSRPREDCGPHPSLSLIRVNETASNNATFSVTNSNVVNYNHPVLALGNANWNGSSIVQFVSGSRQFNISKNTDEIFYSKNVANTTFDCNGVTIWANKTALGFEDYVNTNIGNCTIRNATNGMNLISRTSPGFDNNTIRDMYIYNTTYGVYLDTPGTSADKNLFHTITIINASTTGFWAGTSSGGITFSNITNSTIEETPKGLVLNYWDTGWIQNNSIFGTTYPFYIISGAGSDRNNITRNNISGGPVSADTGNTFCLDVGNAYLDEASARIPAPNDCGPHPYLSEVRVDSSRETGFTWGTTDVTKVNYSSLVIAAANSWNNTIINVVNQTSTNFTGGVYLQKKFNITIDCNGTSIRRNGIAVDYGIDLSNSQSHEIKNCNISGFNSGTSVGILMAATNQTRINNVTFTTPGTYGIYANSGNVRRINITNSRFSWFTTVAIWTYTGSLNNYFWLIEGNYFNNNTIGIYPSHYMTIRNNTFYGQTNYGIAPTGGITMNESVIEFNNFTLNSYGIYLGDGIRNNITNNSFFRHTNYGISFTGTSTTGNLIVNNTFNGTNVSSADTGNDNYFNDSRQGNHWYEYDTAAEGCANADGNTFCDIQYNITGTSNETDWLPFSIETDTVAPSDITLNAPADGFNSSSANVLFNISATDDLDINLTCNITFNGAVNKTLGVQSGGSNSSSITIANIADGNYLWNATCYDNWILSNISTMRRLTIDTIKPAVNLSLNDTDIAFNTDSILIEWNATDVNLDRYYANVSYPNGSLLNQLTNKSQQYVLGPSNLTATGAYNITVYATDGAGNFNATSLTFTVTDSAAPVSMLRSPTNNTFIAIKNISLVCNATNDALSNVSLYTNTNGSWSVNATQNISGIVNQSNFTVTGIADGIYIWNCLVKDAANNQAFNTTNYTFTVDTTVPSDITLNAPINGFNSSSANVLFNISTTDNLDTNLTCNLTLNGIINKTLGVQSGSLNSSSVTIVNIADGNYLWNATCYDNAENSNVSTTRRFMVDTAKPAVNLSLNDTVLEFNIDNVLITWNATDVNLNNYYANVSYPNGSLLSQLTNKSQQYALGPSNLTLTGTYNVTVYATDGAGNFNATSLTFAVNDTINPVVLLISPANGTIAAIKNISFVCNVSDAELANATLYTNVNGSWSVNSTQTTTGTANQSNFTVTGIADGTYLWNCLAIDSSNNQAFNTTNYTFTVDTIIPTDITLNAPANRSNSSSANVLFNISATDNLDTNLTCNITLNGIINKTLGVQSGSLNSSSVTIVNIADGNYLWNATCYDNANNSNVSTTRRFLVDTAKPTVNLSLNDTLLEFNIDSVLIEWNATDTNLDRYYANVSYPNGSLLNQLTNKSQQYVLGPNNLTLTGTYNVTAYATDGAGNFNATSLTFAVTDAISPVVILTSPANDTIIAINNISLACNATNSALSNMSLYTNVNGSWSVNATQTITGTNNQSNFTVTGIADGTYLWNCLAKDAGNNEAFNSTNYTFTVDATKPTSLNLLSPAEAYSSTDTSVNFSFSAIDNLDTNITCNLTLDGVVTNSIGVSNGTAASITRTASVASHSWNITCYDDALNSNSSITRSFTIDAVPAPEEPPEEGGGGGGGPAPPAPPAPEPVVPPPEVTPPPELPPVEDILPQIEPILSSAIEGILGNLAPAQVVIGGKRTKEGVELQFGGKGKITLSSKDSRPKITIEFGDEDLELSIPQYSESAFKTGSLLFALLLITLTVYGGVHITYNKYASRIIMTEQKRAAINHIKAVVKSAGRRPKLKDLDKCMTILSMFAAKELNIETATYKITLKKLKERNNNIAEHEFTKLYKEYASKQGKEITRRELKKIAELIIKLIKRM